MIIRHNFYTELKEEFEECARAAQQQPQATAASDGTQLINALLSMMK